jgi:hypothetical protein
MAQQTDLYFILHSYSRKIDSPTFPVKDFIGFLERYAKQASEESGEWTRWTQDTGSQVWRELNQLEEDGKVLVTNEGSKPCIVMRHYYEELILEAYAKNEPAMPYPDEQFLGRTIPFTELKSMDTSGFLDYLKEGQDSSEGSQLVIKLVFPGPCGSALIPVCMIPMRILEYCMTKVKDYLLRHSNREYVQHKIAFQLSGRDLHLKEFMDKIMSHPVTCLNDMKDGREVAFYFWAFFCSLVKNETGKTDDLLEDKGILQSVYIIEACNSFFKTRAARAKDVETALKNFEVELDKPPYYFSIDEMEKFKDNRGIPLLAQYSQEELDEHIRKRTTQPAKPDELPELLFVRVNGRNCLMRKNRLLTLCSKLLLDARPLVSKAISNRWTILVKDYRKEPAMENDEAFCLLITHYLKDFAPLLLSILKDPRLFLIHEEVDATKKGIPEASRLFEKNTLLPINTLLALRQREILNEIKLLLPFWYTFPLLGKIIHFFQNLGKKKQIVEKIEDESRPVPSGEAVRRDLQTTAREAAEQLVPGNFTLDSYLNEVAARWSQLLDKQAQKSLVSDVNALVRDKLRYMSRFPKTASRDTLDTMAQSIIASSSGLHVITDQHSLFLYIKLYLVKLITSHKG